MTTYRFIDYNELFSKPDNVDMFAIYDIDADELKKFSYGTLKSYFVKTDEPTDVEATVEFQSTSTKPNSILKFGSAGEFHVYSNGTDLFVKGTNSAGKLRFYANSTEILRLDPVNDSIATFGNAINYDGVTGEGLIFDVTTNRAKFTENLTSKSLFTAESGIKLLLNNISYGGAANTGLEFDASSNGTFKQNLNCDTDLNVTGQINANKTGTWSLDAAGQVRCQNKLLVNGDYILMSSGTQLQGGGGFGYSINVDEDIRCGTNKKFMVGPIAGWTGTIPNTFTSISVKGGIISGYT